MKHTGLTILIMIFLALLTATNVTIKRDRTYLREGAGSYHKVITQIPVNSKAKLIQEGDPWLLVEYLQQKGYISNTSLQEKALRNDAFASIQSSTASGKVSQHSISAGVKGFAEKFNSQFRGELSLLDYIYGYQIDPLRYQQFVEETYARHKQFAFRTLFQIPPKSTPDYFMEAHEGFGLAVALVIASLGLYEDPQLQEYVNFVGQNLVSASDGTDIHFRFFLLDLTEPNAYACPGGYIFITKGMIQLIEDEAELAIVLAHEIAHVTRFHGMIEAKAREHHIGSYDVFSELDEDLPDAFSEKAQEIEAELEDEIFDMYETLVQGRLDAYEQEADAIGLVYSARTGYSPLASQVLLNRLINTRYESNNQHYRRESVKQRQAWLDQELEAYRRMNVDYLDQVSRWKRMKKLLDH